MWRQRASNPLPGGGTPAAPLPRVRGGRPHRPAVCLLRRARHGAPPGARQAPGARRRGYRGDNPAAGIGRVGGARGGKGDLYIDIKVRPHPFRRRRGNDIEIELPVSVNEAACGASIRLPTIDGWATVKLPAGTSSGRRLRLRGKGVTDPRGGRRGDQYAVVQVVIPEKLNDRSRELLREFGKLNPGPPAGRGVWERS